MKHMSLGPKKSEDFVARRQALILLYPNQCGVRAWLPEMGRDFIERILTSEVQ